MNTFLVIAAVLCVGAIMTAIGTVLIERAYSPRGRFIDIAGLRQHVLELGPRADPATTVVLIHGAGCCLQDMHLALGEKLAERYRVILIDRPGLGWSERKGPEASSPSDQAQVLRETLDRLNVDRAVLVGHSWGGTMALSFALDHPRRVSGLVLVAPPTHPRLPASIRLNAAFATPAGWLLAWTLTLPLGALLIGPGFRGAFFPQSPPRRYLSRAASFLLLRPTTLRANAADVAGLTSFLAPQAARYGTLAAPTIILTGDRDTIVSPEHHAMKLAADVPSAKIRVFPGLGHMLHHSVPHDVIAAVEELSGAPGGG